MAKQLLNYQLRIDVDVAGGTKRVIFCSGSANDSVLTNYVAGVSCGNMPRELTGGELAGTLGDFLAAHKAELEGNM